MPYQRGQFWIRRFQKQAPALSLALAALAAPPAIVLGNAYAEGVSPAEIELGITIPLVGGLAVPLDGLIVVLRNP
jgi:hypothetical protein